MAIKIDIPKRGTIELQHAVFEVNGTLAIDGVAITGVTERLKALAEHLSIHLLTTGTHGKLAELEQALGFPLHVTHRGDEKMRYIQNLGPSTVIAFGHGANDASMLRLAAIGVAVMTPEGLASRSVQNADIITYGPKNAIELLLNPARLIATLQD